MRKCKQVKEIFFWFRVNLSCLVGEKVLKSERKFCFGFFVVICYGCLEILFIFYISNIEVY